MTVVPLLPPQPTNITPVRGTWRSVTNLSVSDVGTQRMRPVVSSMDTDVVS